MPDLAHDANASVAQEPQASGRSIGKPKSGVGVEDQAGSHYPRARATSLPLDTIALSQASLLPHLEPQTSTRWCY